MKVWAYVIFAGLCGIVSFEGTLLSAYASDPVTDAKIEVLERKVRALFARTNNGAHSADNQTGAIGTQNSSPQSRALVADLLAKVGSLESQMRSLNGRLEEYEHKLRQQDDAMGLLRKELSLQREDMSAAIAAGSQSQLPVTKVESQKEASNASIVPNVNTASEIVPKVVLPEAGPAGQYKYAFAFIQKNDLASGRIALEQFMAANPKDSLAGNAKYWLGRVHLQQGRNGQAAQQLLSLIEDHPNHPKRADALVDLADALVKLDSSEDACNALAEFQRVKKDGTARLETRAKRVSEAASCN